MFPFTMQDFLKTILRYAGSRRHFIISATAALAVTALTACHNRPIETGVSLSLALEREASFSDLRYEISFVIPESQDSLPQGTTTIRFKHDSRRDIVLDFKNGSVTRVSCGNTPLKYIFTNEHIIIAKSQLKKINPEQDGITISFTPGEGSLNRRNGFAYTLSVPDRARTLMPCFDQPGLKARYSLTLEVPDGWCAVSNGAVCETFENVYHFAETEPLSTYLFAFMAGMFEREELSQEGRTVGLYHRETDPCKTAQTTEILQLVHECIGWLEEYTGIPYPFAKYDLIILPGFQFGGMEHTGATLYNDNRMFLASNAGIREETDRFSLIAHETAHMWFGDLVTMQWFNDVWTKEVFANYFAARMTSEKYPEVDGRMHRLDYMRYAFAEDRTPGASPIKQPLDNMKNAGLMYGNIIYDKAPVVMEMLAELCGEEPFREGIREYLGSFSYGNATWEELVEILDRHSPENLGEWSREWVFTAGIPEMDWRGRENLPPFDSLCYGYFKMDAHQTDAARAVALASDSQSLKGFILLNLNENLENTPADSTYIGFLLSFMEKENDPMLFSQAAGYLSRYHFAHYGGEDISVPLWNMVEGKEDATCRRLAYNVITECCHDSISTSRLVEFFSDPSGVPAIQLSEKQLTSLAYELAVRLPSEHDKIREIARSRISNPDRLASFDFVWPATSPCPKVRDSVFNSLLFRENREIEPDVLQSLALLNHKTRALEAEKYIRPALDIIEEIQITGDIFFPQNWVKALLGGHKGNRAREEAEKTECHRLLKNKILINLPPN